MKKRKMKKKKGSKDLSSKYMSIYGDTDFSHNRLKEKKRRIFLLNNKDVM